MLGEFMHESLKQEGGTGDKDGMVDVWQHRRLLIFSLEVHAVEEVMGDVDWLERCAGSCI
jgi:hypothetical protein